MNTLTQDRARQLAREQVGGRDARILIAAEERLGRALERGELISRLRAECNQQGWMHVYLDDHPLIEFGPVEYSVSQRGESTYLSASQSFRRSQ